MPLQGEKADGPRQLPLANRTEILERLALFIKKHFRTRRQFGMRINATSGTTSRWFGQERALPDAPALFRMAKDAKMSLDWLMTGRGPEMIGLSTNVGDLRETLREAHIAQLVKRGVARSDAEQFTPSGAHLLKRDLKRHVEDWNSYSEQIKLRERMKKLRPRSLGTAIEELLGDE